MKKIFTNMAMLTTALATTIAPLSALAATPAYATEPTNIAAQIINCEPTDTDCIAKDDAVTITQIENNVKFTKSAKPVTNQPGFVDITLSTSGPVQPVPEDIYVVIVFDQSNSMTNDGSSKLADAKTGAVAFSEALLASPNVNAYLSVVNFGTQASSPTAFKTGVLSKDTDLNGTIRDWTNLQDAIAEASNKLNPTGTSDEELKVKNSPNKFIVVMSDGEPTACMIAAGTSNTCASTIQATLNSTSARTPSQTESYYSYYADYINAATTIATEAKATGIGFYSIGYDVANNSAAQNTLKSIASNDDQYFIATADNSSSIGEAFLRTLPGLTYIAAGNNAIATDTIGDDFKYTSAIYGKITEQNGIVSCDLGEINTVASSCTFRIELDINDTCWDVNLGDLYDTNNGAALTFREYQTDPDTGLYLKDPATGKPIPANQDTNINITTSPQYALTAEDIALLYCPIESDIHILKDVIDDTSDKIALPTDASDLEFTFEVTIYGPNDTPYTGNYSLNGGIYQPYTGTFSVQASGNQPAFITVPDIAMVSKVTVSEIDNQTDDFTPQFIDLEGTWNNNQIMEFTFTNVYAPEICQYDDTLPASDPKCAQPGKGDDLVVPQLPTTGQFTQPSNGSSQTASLNNAYIVLTLIATSTLLAGTYRYKKAAAEAKK